MNRFSGSARLHLAAAVTAFAAAFLLTCQTAKTDGVIQVDVLISRIKTAECLRLSVVDAAGARNDSEPVRLNPAGAGLTDQGNGALLWRVDVRQDGLLSPVTLQALALGADCSTELTEEHSKKVISGWNPSTGAVKLFVPGGSEPSSDAGVDGGVPESQRCADAIDNDLDGFIDCADDECPSSTPCGTGLNGAGASCKGKQCVETNCANQEDDNRDTFADCQDPACTEQSCTDGGVCDPKGKFCKTDTETFCGDGADNDKDGFVDCLDKDCDKIACSDQLRCTAGEVCVTSDNGSGSCNTNAVVSTCDRPGQCQKKTPVGQCLPVDGGVCSYSVDTGAECDAGALCAVKSTCSAAGVCVPMMMKSCPKVQCKELTLCNPANGQCPVSTKNEDDFTACTDAAAAPGACLVGDCIARATLSNLPATLLTQNADALLTVPVTCTLSVNTTDGAVSKTGTNCPTVSSLPEVTQASNGFAPKVRVLVAKRIVIEGKVVAQGDQALAIVAQDELVLAATGVVDVSAAGLVPGAGSGTNCGQAGALDGVKSGNGDFAGGGAGGTFGTAGGSGGAAKERLTIKANGGAVRAINGNDVDLMPLRGGCPGGKGGGADSDRGGPGSAGGAVQLYAGIRMKLFGSILSAGAGGQSGSKDKQQGGGGAGSGGSILIESAQLEIGAAKLLAMGGGGATGRSLAGDLTTGDGQAGSKTSAAAAVGGPLIESDVAHGQGGNGSGVQPQASAQPGADGEASDNPKKSTGGGGGGGLGIIRINAVKCTNAGTGLIAPVPGTGAGLATCR